MPVITIIRTPEWATVDTLPPKAVINLPAVLADPLLLAGEAVRTPGAVITHTSPFGDSGTSGGGGGGGGDDVTDWGSFTDGRPGIVTINGVTQTIGRDGSGNIISYTIELSGADDIVTTISYDNGYSEASANIIRGGAVDMTEAQAKALRDEKLAPAGLAAIGFKLRINDLPTFKSAGGVSTNGTWPLEWDGRILRPIGACVLQDFVVGAHNNLSTESAAFSNILFPIWLLKPGLKLVTRLQHEAAGGTNSTLRSRVKFGGTEVFNGASSSAASATNTFEAVLVATGDATQIGSVQAAAGSGGTASSGAAAISATLDSTGANVAVTCTGQVTVTDKNITHRYMTVALENA